jgi:ubiquinone/menaquinone biosynthesis C-methylase UbiE
MINKKKYIQFVNSNIYLTDCQKTNFMILLENINTHYASPKSNKQFVTYINNNVENVINIGNLLLVLNHFFNNDISNIVIEQIKKNENITDSTIINMLINLNKLKKKIEIPQIIFTYKKCNFWDYMFQNLILGYKQITGTDSLNNITYLDYGCGSGKKTERFYKLAKIKNENVYGADIENWGPYKQKKINYPFHFTFIKKNKIDYPDNSFDLVTCIFVLHHVKELKKNIKEIKRVLKPNGILILIEHDNHNDNDNMILDILHTLYEVFYDKNINYLQNPSYSKYYNFMEWDFIFNSLGFQYKKSHYLFTELSKKIRYDSPYYSFYQNSK